MQSPILRRRNITRNKWRSRYQPTDILQLPTRLSQLNIFNPFITLLRAAYSTDYQIHDLKPLGSLPLQGYKHGRNRIRQWAWATNLPWASAQEQLSRTLKLYSKLECILPQVFSSDKIRPFSSSSLSYHREAGRLRVEANTKKPQQDSGTPNRNRNSKARDSETAHDSRLSEKISEIEKIATTWIHGGPHGLFTPIQPLNRCLVLLVLDVYISPWGILPSVLSNSTFLSRKYARSPQHSREYRNLMPP